MNARRFALCSLDKVIPIGVTLPAVLVPPQERYASGNEDIAVGVPELMYTGIVVEPTVDVPILVAVVAVVAVVAFPEILIPQVPVAPDPDLVGASVMPYPDKVVGFDVKEANV